MKILYIATSFPEPSKGATIYTDLAEALQKAGHEITVTVAEQARNKKQTELGIERGFEVLRIVTGDYYDVGFVKKGITTIKMPYLMRHGIKKYLKDRKFDFILFESPPVSNYGLVRWAKKYFNCPAYLMLKDVFPQNAVDLGILKPNGLIFRYFSRMEKRLYKTADFIGCMSPANKDYIIKHNNWLDPNKLEIFPNTKKLSNDIEPTGYPIRERHNIPKKSCLFLFGGNMGRPQCIDLLCEVIKECKDEDNVFFFFVGRGTDRYKLENTINDYDIKNAIVIENLPRDEYEQIIKEADVGLIVLDPRFTIPNFPSRILSYMEFGKPVLAITDKITDIKNLIKEAQCGEWVWSGNINEVVDTVKRMAKDSELPLHGMNGRRYIESHFTVEHSVKILEKHFK